MKKYICDECGKKYRSRSLIQFKGKFLCRFCRQKTPTYKIQQSASNIGKGYIKLDDALKKIYEPKIYINKKTNGGYCILHLPICFKGTKLKFELIDEEENDNT